jgi:predicted GIY-YIG superfamily endonuclease
MSKRKSLSKSRVITDHEKQLVAKISLNKQLIDEKRKENNRLTAELKQIRKYGSYKPNKVKLYALRLEGGCWYIGMTYNVQRRFAKHSSGKGAIWTRLHKPVEIVEVRETECIMQEDAAHLEDDMTIEYAMIYGSDSVRGGGYCQTKPRWPATVIENELVQFAAA